MDPNAFLCRACYTAIGGADAPIYEAARKRGEGHCGRPDTGKPSQVRKRRGHPVDYPFWLTEKGE